MEALFCPHCGSPVLLRGERWECGFCGDFGDISSLLPPEQEKLAGEDMEELERGVLALIEGAEELLGPGEDTRLQALRLALWGMTRALCAPEARTAGRLRSLRAFFEEYSFCTAEEVLGAALEGKPAFEEEFSLESGRLGSFWAGLPDRGPDGRAGGLLKMLEGLGSVQSFFSGEDREQLLRRWERALDNRGREG